MPVRSRPGGLAFLDSLGNDVLTRQAGFSPARGMSRRGQAMAGRPNSFPIAETHSMKTSGKNPRPAQPVRQVTVDAGLLPKTANAKRGPDAADRPATATVNIVAPVPPAVSAARLEMKQQAMKSALMKVGAAIDGGEIPAAEAKRFVLGRVVRGLGSVEAAEKWYRSHHFAELGGRTPAQLVRAGELKALLAQLDAAKAEPKA